MMVSSDNAPYPLKALSIGPIDTRISFDLKSRFIVLLSGSRLQALRDRLLDSQMASFLPSSVAESAYVSSFLHNKIPLEEDGVNVSRSARYNLSFKLKRKWLSAGGLIASLPPSGLTCLGLAATPEEIMTVIRSEVETSDAWVRFLASHPGHGSALWDSCVKAFRMEKELPVHFSSIPRNRM